MRWFWIDKFIEFESGKRALAVKNVTLAEEHLHDRLCGPALMPATLMIEGMAQTAGILVGEANGFRENVILAKIRQAEFEDWGRPGDRLQYEAVVESIDDRGAVTRGVVLRDGSPIARIDLMFSHVRPGSGRTVPDDNFVFSESMLSMLGSFRT